MAKEKKYPIAIYNWPEDEKPREKLLKFSTDKLSDIIFMFANAYLSFISHKLLLCQNSS